MGLWRNDDRSLPKTAKLIWREIDNIGDRYAQIHRRNKSIDQYLTFLPLNLKYLVIFFNQTTKNGLWFQTLHIKLIYSFNFDGICPSKIVCSFLWIIFIIFISIPKYVKLVGKNKHMGMWKLISDSICYIPSICLEVWSSKHSI